MGKIFMKSLKTNIILFMFWRGEGCGMMGGGGRVGKRILATFDIMQRNILQLLCSNFWISASAMKEVFYGALVGCRKDSK